MPQRRSSILAGIVVELLLLLGTIVTGIVVVATVAVTLARWENWCIFTIKVTCKGGGTIGIGNGASSLCDFCVRLQIVAIVFSAAFAAYRIMVLLSRRYNMCADISRSYGVSSSYSVMKVAEVAAWISFLFWVGLTVFSFVLFIKARQGNRQMVQTPGAIPAITVADPVDVNNPV